MSGDIARWREHYRDVTIILIEDSSDDIELLMRALKRNGFSNKVVTFNDGAQALDYLQHLGNPDQGGADDGRSQREQPAIVLLDIKLPRVDGLEVLAHIKNEPGLRSIPVIVLTSSRQERDIDRAYRLGVNSYICKPTDFDEFLQVIQNFGQFWLHTAEIPSYIMNYGL